jgi:hypothetical protein
MPAAAATVATVAAWVLCAAPAAPPEPPHELGLRIRVAGRATQDENNSGDLRLRGRLTSAEIEVRYQYENWLRAAAEVDLGPVPPTNGAAWGPAVKDLYLRLGRPRMAVRAGHFKPPTSAVELESGWDLPLVRRGWLHDVLEATAVAGRRLGVQGELRLKEPVDLRFRAGAFHLLPSAQTGTTLAVTSLAGRAEVGLGALAVGAFAQAGLSSGGSTVVGGGVDAVGEWTPGDPWVVRAWADVVAGNSPSFPLTPYLAGRAIGAVRLGGLEARSPYVEVFATVEGVTADLSLGGNGGPLAGGGGGLTGGWWDLARLTFQAEGRSDGEWAIHGRLGASLDAAFNFQGEGVTR